MLTVYIETKVQNQHIQNLERSSRDTHVIRKAKNIKQKSG